jgi:endogenous inhibitor of DNA gyrase (YacG/DUF329 family)
MGKKVKTEANITEVKPLVEEVIAKNCVMCGRSSEVVAKETNEPLCNYCNQVNNIILGK